MFRRGSQIIAVPLVALIATTAVIFMDLTGALADQGATVAETAKTEPEYHTPLAGEPLRTMFMGKPVYVPPQDRANVTALTLGVTFYEPRQGDTAGSPIAALYLKRTWDHARTRNIISIFVNELEYDRSFGALEVIGRFENSTIPGGQTEILNNREIQESSVEWGILSASLGPGLRFRVAPYQVDNDLRLQLLGRVGYFYASKTDDTGPDTVLPPDTMLYGTKLRGRFDGMRRNLLELPHSGLAAGFDLDFTHRDKWADFGSAAARFTSSDTRNYAQYTGYLMAVSAIPGLSEKNRFLVSFHGGTTEQKSVDRFNSFRIGGGPLQGESDDLFRPNYPGTMFNTIQVSSYAMTAVEYRRELAFFLYGHIRGTFIWADRATVLAGNQIGFKNDHGEAATVGIDTGFLWNSSIYLDYSWDSGFIRDGKSGSGLILIWNKSF